MYRMTGEMKIMFTTTTSQSQINNWPLIGTLIGLVSLLVLLGSCGFCYYYVW
jgi:hypothetical protein